MENTAGKKPLSVLDKYNVTFSTAINTILEKYKYHSSVLNIKKTLNKPNIFSFSEVTTTDVLKLKRININKAMGEDQIPPKLIETADNFLVEPVSRFSLTRQKEPQLHLLANVVLISIFTPTADLLVFLILFRK